MLKQVIDNDSTLKTFADLADYQSIANYLNDRPLIDNPEAQGTVPASNAKTLIGLLSASDLATFLGTRDFQQWIAGVLQKIDALEAGETKDNEELAAKALLGTLIDEGLLTSSFQQLVVALQSNATAMSYLLTLIARDELLSTNVITTLATELAKTQPDPGYQSQVPGNPRYTTLGLGGPWTAADVQEELVKTR